MTTVKLPEDELEFYRKQTVLTESNILSGEFPARRVQANQAHHYRYWLKVFRIEITAENLAKSKTLHSLCRMNCDVAFNQGVIIPIIDKILSEFPEAKHQEHDDIETTTDFDGKLTKMKLPANKAKI